jgi:hypothetical protein
LTPEPIFSGFHLLYGVSSNKDAIHLTVAAVDGSTQVLEKKFRFIFSPKNILNREEIVGSVRT